MNIVYNLPEHIYTDTRIKLISFNSMTEIICVHTSVRKYPMFINIAKLNTSFIPIKDSTYILNAIKKIKLNYLLKR